MKNKQNNGFIKNPFLYILIIVVLMTGFQYFFSGDTGGRSQQINYTELVKEIKENNVTEMSYQPNGSVVEISGTYKTPQESKEDTGILFFTPNVSKVERFTSIILPSDITISDLQKLASEHNTEISIKRESSSGMWITILTSIVPFVIVIFFFMSMMNQGGGGGARGAMNFGRNKARAANKEDIKVRFSDVAGAEEEKQELVEVVEFLKDRKRYTKLGARIPAGVLLEGPPGTGKTLLAKAVAEKAGVPFFSISGSDFVEMFVGIAGFPKGSEAFRHVFCGGMLPISGNARKCIADRREKRKAVRTPLRRTAFWGKECCPCRRNGRIRQLVVSPWKTREDPFTGVWSSWSAGECVSSARRGPCARSSTTIGA